MRFVDVFHDLDSSMDTWNSLFSKVYPASFSTVFDFQELSDVETSPKCKRWYIKIDGEKQPYYKKLYPKFKIAGDCDFNFNSKKVNQFSKLISYKDYPLLMKCHQLHHELTNFSFMPITGGMNNTKGCLRCVGENGIESRSFDRLDLFLYELNKYFNGDKTTRIFSSHNKDALVWYLGLFNSDIYSYCSTIHLIDNKEFVNELIASGKRPINNGIAAKEYMELALRYWCLKANKLREYNIDISL